jgi:hypothetical protein
MNDIKWHKNVIKKCCVDGHNINNLIFYTQQDAVYKVDNVEITAIIEIYKMSFSIYLIQIRSLDHQML